MAEIIYGGETNMRMRISIIACLCTLASFHLFIGTSCVNDGSCQGEACAEKPTEATVESPNEENPHEIITVDDKTENQVKEEHKRSEETLKKEEKAAIDEAIPNPQESKKEEVVLQEKPEEKAQEQVVETTSDAYVAEEAPPQELDPVEEVMPGETSPDGTVSSNLALKVKKIFGGSYSNAPGGNYVHSVSDKQGNIYVVGSFRDYVRWNKQTLVSKGETDILVAKVSPKGTLLWVVSAGGASDDYGSRLAFNSKAELFLVGNFSGSIKLGSQTLHSKGKSDGFFVKVNTNNEDFTKAVHIHSTETIYFSNLFVDKQDNFYFTGNFQAKMTFLTKDIDIKEPSNEFLVKVDSSGKVVYSHVFGFSDPYPGTRLKIDSKLNILLYVSYKGSIRFLAKKHNSRGNYDGFLTKIDPKGSVIWTHAFGSAGLDFINNVKVGSKDDVFVLGTYRQTLNFGSKSLTSTGGATGFLAKVTKLGTLGFLKSFGGTSHSQGYGFALDKNDNGYISGFFSKDSKFDNISVTGTGIRECFVSKIDANGKFSWVKSLPSTGHSSSRLLKLRKDGNILILGDFTKDIDFQGQKVTSKRERNQFVALFDTSGKLKWKQTIPADSDIELWWHVQANDDLVLLGGFQGRVELGNKSAKSQSGAIFAASIDSSGSFGWVGQSGGTHGNVYLKDVTTDSTGHIIVTGAFTLGIEIDNLKLEPKSWNLDDGFVVKLKPDGTAVWASSFVMQNQTFGGVDPDIELHVVVDSKDEIYVAGSSQKTGMFVRKFDTTGSVSWTKNFGKDPFTDRVFDMAINSKNEIILVGRYSSPASFGSLTATAKYAQSGFLAIQKNDGTFASVKTYGADVAGEGKRIALDSNENMFVVGTFFGKDFDYDGANQQRSSSNTEGFLFKADPSGKFLWIESSIKDAFALKVNASDEIFVAGAFDGELKLGTQTIKSQGQRDAILVQLDKLGNYKMHRTLGTKGKDELSSLALGPQTGLFAFGSFAGSLKTSVGTLQSVGQTDSLLVRLDGQLKPTWLFQLGGVFQEKAEQVIVGEKGKRVIVIGRTNSPHFVSSNKNLEAGGAFLFVFEP